MTSSPKPPIDVEATLRLMDVADEIRRQQQEHQEVLRVVETSTRERIKAQVIRLYQGLGESIAPEHVDLAIDRFLAEQHRFREPPPSLKLTLASLYVRRKELGRRYGLPIVVVVSVLCVAWAGIWQWNELGLRRQERLVEEAVSSLSLQRRALMDRLESVGSDPLAVGLPVPDRQRFDTRLSGARTALERLDAFVTDYPPEDDARSAVTRANFARVGGLAKVAERSLEASLREVGEAEALLDVERGLFQSRARLERQIVVVRGGTLPPVMRSRAETLVATATASLEARELDRSNELEASLTELMREAERYAELEAAVSRLYASIRAVAKEPAAMERAAEMHHEAEQHVASVSVARLEDVVGRLRELDKNLDHEYRVAIVGGVWRYQDDAPNVRNYYLRVRALDSRGQPFSLSFTNEETREVETVTEWAERVPKEVYDRIAADKQDNGLIDDDLFASKDRGYLEMKRRYPDLGQITRW